jgi:NAD(P)H dehydrogenase (quinone)
MRMLVVVASDTGRTWRMAEALADGAREAGAEVELVKAAAATPEQALAADALVLGSGVHMGGPESSMRAFFERLAPLWMQGALVGRVGAAFATAGNGGRGGAELTLISLWANLAEHGLVLVPMHNRLAGFPQAGCHWGPVAWTNPRKAGWASAHLQAARARPPRRRKCAARWRASAAAT